MIFIVKDGLVSGKDKLSEVCLDLDLNGLLISDNQTNMGIYFIPETERFQMFKV